MRQYFFEGDKDGAPFPRDKRAIVYQRAKRELDKRPFGTQFDVYQEQYEWLHHSIAPGQTLAACGAAHIGRRGTARSPIPQAC